MTNEKMRELSGNVTSLSMLTGFLYLLMRDHLTPGHVENLIDSIEQSNFPMVFTNGWLARYADCLATRLTGSEHLIGFDDEDKN